MLNVWTPRSGVLPDAKRLGIHLQCLLRVFVATFRAGPSDRYAVEGDACGALCCKLGVILRPDRGVHLVWFYSFSELRIAMNFALFSTQEGISCIDL